MNDTYTAAREHLEAANRHVAEAEERIAQLRQRVEDMRASGIPTERPQALLALLQDALATMEQHRRLILRELSEHRQARRSRLR